MLAPNLPNLITGTLASLAAIASLVLAIRNRSNKNFLRIIVACWTLLPPIYFFAEFHVARYAIRQKGPPNGSWTSEAVVREFDDYKDSQEQATRVWGAVAIVLGALFLKSDD